MTKRRIVFIIALTFFTILMLYYIDQIMQMTYVNKTAIKLVFLLLIPILYVFITKDQYLSSSIRKPFLSNKESTLIVSSIVFFGIIALFFIFQNQFNTATLIMELEEKYKINASNFIFYGLYIIIFNSFIEEFFFRGFIFLNFKNLGHKKLGYAFSSTAFALYHIAIFQNWFSTSIFILSLLGLIAGGLLFDYLDDLTDSFVNSWLVHLSADLAIILIGFYLFYTA